MTSKEILALQMKHLCMQVKAIRKRREGKGWYKGSALWGKASVDAGREYAAKKGDK